MKNMIKWMKDFYSKLNRSHNNLKNLYSIINVFPPNFLSIIVLVFWQLVCLVYSNPELLYFTIICILAFLVPNLKELDIVPEFLRSVIKKLANHFFVKHLLLIIAYIWDNIT